MSCLHRIIFILVSLLTAMSARGEKIGLVLSGGGAKGIAHVGVIKALEENGIPIDYVAGTSMGAIVGGFYACGYSPEKMMKLFTSRAFAEWSTGVVPPQKKFFFNCPAPTPELMRISAGMRNDSLRIVANNIYKGYVVSPLPMNIEFPLLFTRYQIQCNSDFDRLFVPFRCVYSDVYHKHKVVARKGNLPNSIRASMTFPMVFKPIEMDGILAYDGGIYDNFPVDVMREEFNPDFIVGVSVSTPDGKPQPNNAYSQLEDLIIQNNDYSLPAEEGVKIQVPVSNFGVLDFGKAREIYDIGYRTGLQWVDSIRSRISSERSPVNVAERRSRFNAATPEDIVIDSVQVGGNVTPVEADFIRFRFTDGKAVPFGEKQMQTAYYHLISENMISDLVPVLNQREESGDTCTLSLQGTVAQKFYGAIGGWATSSPNSMLYLSGGYQRLDFHSIDTSLSGWLGQSYLAGMLKGKYHLHTAVPSRVEFTAVAERQKFLNRQHFFFEGDDSPSIIRHQNYLKGSYIVATGQSSRIQADVGYTHIYDNYYSRTTPEYLTGKRDESQYRVWAGHLKWEYNTLDNMIFPSGGSEFAVNISGERVSSRFLPHGEKKSGGGFINYGRGTLLLKWRRYYPVLNNFALGTLVQGAITVGPLKDNYTATLIEAPDFAPLTSMTSIFNPRYRGRDFVAVGVMPVWKLFSRFQLRGDFYLFMNARNMVRTPDGMARFDGWFRKGSVLGEVSAVFNFPSASLSAYANYLSSPSGTWSYGVSFGLLFEAPRFLR